MLYYIAIGLQGQAWKFPGIEPLPGIEPFHAEFLGTAPLSVPHWGGGSCHETATTKAGIYRKGDEETPNF